MKTISFQTDILPLKNELFRLALRITQNRRGRGCGAGNDAEGLERAFRVGQNR